MQLAVSNNNNKTTTENIMTQTTVAKFIQAVNQDPTLVAELKAAVDNESYYQIAKAHGYQFTPEELQDELSQKSLEELAMTINPGLAPRQHLSGQ
jgi:predicted ribosomally synthesized peptide with nif11-like leader